MGILRIFIGIAMLLLFAATVHSAGQNDSTITWVNPSTTSIQASLSATRCMNSAGSQNLIARVLKIPSGDPDLAASVTALVTKPDGDTNNLTFSSQGDGNYSINFDFNVNGTYKLEFSASDTQVNSTHDFNEYIYVKDFNIRVSFLNNSASYNPGDTVTIRALVLNTDNNAFNDLNSSISVFYPNTTTLVSGEQMSGLGNGEYIYSLIARSTAGTYSATASFSCNDESDSNSLGRFIVQNSGTSTTSTSSSGGGGGGSSGTTPSGTVSEWLKATIQDFNFNRLILGKPAITSLRIFHDIPKQTSFLVELQIVRDSTIEFYSEETIPLLAPNKALEVTLSHEWIPKTAGTYIASISLSSPDKKISYDTKTLRFDIEGTLRYDLETICSAGIVPAGEPYDFNIFAYNLGDYYEDVQLSWWIEDSAGQKIGYASAPIAIMPRASISRKTSVFIPANIKSGVYAANAKLILNDVEKKAACSFTIKTQSIYYDESISQLEKQAVELEKEISQNLAEGALPEYLREQLSELKKKIIALKLSVASQKYDGLNETITRTYSELNEVRELTGKASKEAALGEFPTTAIIGIAITLIFLILAIQIIRKGKKRSVPKIINAIEKSIERLLGFNG